LAHLLDEFEDEVVGRPISVDISDLLNSFRCNLDVEELSLSSNQLRSEAEKSRLIFTAGEGVGISSPVVGRLTDKASLTAQEPSWMSQDGNSRSTEVKLLPLEIRTFQVTCPSYEDA